MTLRDLFVVITLIVLFVSNMIFIHRYRELQQENEDKIYELIDQKFSTIDQKLITLNSGIDSLSIQYDSIKSAQYEVIKTNKQAKEQADRLIRAYRDIIVELPVY